MIDLHTHSTYSDGSMAPDELVRHAKSAGLTAISLTDHDTVDGVAAAVATGRDIGIEVVPGIELSASSRTETHILGYFIDTKNAGLKGSLSRALEVRERRMSETADALKRLGFDVTQRDARDCAGGAIIGRAHFARAMVAKGYAGSVKEAFDRYLSVGRPAYINVQLLSPGECVRLIRSCGGLAFVAHVHTTRLDGDELYTFLKGLKDEGLSGIEGYYSEYTPARQLEYTQLASRLGLAVSGGTDFHGTMKPHITIGVGFGNMSVPDEVLLDLKSLLSQEVS